MLPGPAVPGSCLASFHFLWAIHPIRPVLRSIDLWIKGCVKSRAFLLRHHARFPSLSGAASQTSLSTNTSTLDTCCHIRYCNPCFPDCIRNGTGSVQWRILNLLGIRPPHDVAVLHLQELLQDLLSCGSLRTVPRTCAFASCSQG